MLKRSDRGIGAAVHGAHDRVEPGADDAADHGVLAGDEGRTSPCWRGVAEVHETMSGPANSRYTTRVAQISCYTGAVEKARQNVTLVVDEDLLLAARKVALDRRTSVNQMVREYLAALVEEPNRRRIARTRLKKAFETGLVDVGDRKWSRDDLYDR